ncbi:MAG TPA: thiamine pyrophosphate-dependent dehydrogenase E1 component subunit alpha [Gemmatimonadaceae bacterium]|jgi:Pyruvate/2-oxoglutarate dehydrogenase complex, dehydrogenase (E1) component, eukaryotic type, alpha subunit
MRRFAAFEPPEYNVWERDDAAVREYRATLERDRDRARMIGRLDNDALLDIYRGMARNRLTDIALKRMVRQGVISKAWLGTGEEATTIGPVHALRRSGETRDAVAPMIRNGGACHEFGMPVADMLRAYMGTSDGPSGGRDGHYGNLALGILAPISHVGDVVPVAAGIALSMRLRGSDSVVMTWIGDGSTKAGTAHEGLNFAAVQRVPAIFIIQNNQVALGTLLAQHHLAAGRGNFADWPTAYGMWGGVFDGNNVLDAYALAALAVERCRVGDGPALLVAETFRMGGHATHDEAEARRTIPAEQFAEWGRRDPIALYEEYLVDSGIARETLAEVEDEVAREVEHAQSEALRSRDNAMPSGESALLGVYVGDRN